MNYEIYQCFGVCALVFTFLNSNKLCKISIFSFIAGFFPFLFNFFIKISLFYCKIISQAYACIKELFYVTFNPLIVQIIFSLYFFFDYFWAIYLLFTIFSILLLSVPCYIYKYINEKPSNDLFSYSIQLKISVFLMLFFVLPYNYALISSVSVLILDLLIKKKKLKK